MRRATPSSCARRGGETLATFDDPADVFEDADAYPAVESEIKDFDEWTEIKRPVVPSVSFGPDGLDRSMVDVIAVTRDGLLVLEDGGNTKVPIDEFGQRRRSGPPSRR